MFKHNTQGENIINLESQMVKRVLKFHRGQLRQHPWPMGRIIR